MYVVEKDELHELKDMSLGKRIKWIRNKAAEINSDMNHKPYSIYRMAEQTGIAQSTISKIESEDAKEPKAWVIEKIAKYLGVSIEVFFDSFYEHPKRFIIGSQGTIQEDKRNDEIVPFNLLDKHYEAQISLSIFTSNGELYEKNSINERVELSTLEREELFEEIQYIINKVRKRRKQWKAQQAAIKNATISQFIDND